MKTWTKFHLTVAAGLALSLANVTQAGPVDILKVDFNSASSPTESGFQPMTTASTNFASTPLGTVTVAITGHEAFFDRGGPADSGAFTYGDLYRDFVYRNNGAFTVNISGLTTTPHFELRLYGFDYDNEPSGVHTNTYTPISGTGGAAAQSFYTTGVTPSFNEQASVLVDWITNPSGEIVFTVSDTAGSGFSRLNGFELSIPEPSVALLLACGGLILWRRRTMD
jgi:hypothetical protein